MKTLWLVYWEDCTVVTDTFEKAVAYVEKEVERMGYKDSLTISFDAKDQGYNYIGRDYQYKYFFNGKEQTVYVTINEIQYI